MTTALARLRAFWAQQVHLNQLHLDRHDISGQDALAAMRTLRWSGGELVGDCLPPAQNPSRPRL